MEINKKGAFRLVFMFRKFVIKIPRIKYGYKFFLQGIISNLSEKEWSGFDKRLCPVIYCNSFGLVLIMKKAQPYDGFINFKEFEDLPLDPHNDNFGIYNNRLVLVDYGLNMEQFICPNCKKYLDVILLDTKNSYFQT